MAMMTFRYITEEGDSGDDKSDDSDRIVWVGLKTKRIFNHHLVNIELELGEEEKEEEDSCDKWAGRCSALNPCLAHWDP